MDKHWRAHPDKGCNFIEAEAFFPKRRPGLALEEQEERAKAACRGCPVKKECLDFALDNNEEGVWGGMTEKERKALRKQRRAA